MTSANLSCPRCHGEYRYVGDDDGKNLYECGDCGDALEQGPAEAFVEDDDEEGLSVELVRDLLRGDDE